MLSDRMARKDQSYQDLSDKLENRVEDAADFAENNCEKLARRTQDRLQDHLERAKESVQKEAQHRSGSLHEVQDQFEELQTTETQKEEHARAIVGANSFLAQNDPFPLALGALCSVACAFLVFFVKRKTPQVDLHQNLLG